MQGCEHQECGEKAAAAWSCDVCCFAFSCFVWWLTVHKISAVMLDLECTYYRYRYLFWVLLCKLLCFTWYRCYLHPLHPCHTLMHVICKAFYKLALVQMKLIGTQFFFNKTYYQYMLQTVLTLRPPSCFVSIFLPPFYSFHLWAPAPISTPMFLLSKWYMHVQLTTQ